MSELNTPLMQSLSRVVEGKATFEEAQSAAEKSLVYIREANKYWAETAELGYKVPAEVTNSITDRHWQHICALVQAIAHSFNATAFTPTIREQAEVAGISESTIEVWFHSRVHADRFKSILDALSIDNRLVSDGVWHKFGCFIYREGQG
jgi:hypothetical protein